MFDAHIHLYMGRCDTPRDFLAKTQSAGITGGNIFTPGPEWTIGEAEGDFRWEARLEQIFEFTSQTPGFYPFFWFNPTMADAEKQIQTAAERGIRGYKIICDKYYPADCLKACEVIAETGLPVMFHSGVLGGGRDQLSCKYNIPTQFEILFSVKKLRFSLAHLGWPWIDDYMAMVAKSAFTWDPDFGNTMYFDLTPGTPGISREDAEYKFGFIINAFKFGAPPHGGLAYGLDRFVSLFAGLDSIRDCIAFPKNNSGRDVMLDAPSFVDQKQLDEDFIALNLPTEA